jgi:alkanesulfonate monooxygenase SsuD/methylene tetrahydromethanopterin reductase-like flavin-dependent oxidoreductase (luciferase family)
MQFGVFYEHQLPRPWGPGGLDERTHLHHALEQAELVDRLGFDYFWEVEHHFLEEYSHSSAPEVFLGAVSQRTQRIRLGHGIVQTPPPYNHPARVAERIATLDLLSDGRVDFGTGESTTDVELGGFGVDRAEKHALWEEGLEVAVRCLVEEPFTGHHGAEVDMPRRNVVPKPLQQPHPPLWMACTRRETIQLAARRGLGALSFAFIGGAEARTWVDEYYSLLATECDPLGYAVNPNLAVVTTFMCCEDEQEALDKGLDGAQFFAYSLAHYVLGTEHNAGATTLWSDFETNRAALGLSRDAATARGEALAPRSEAGADGAQALRGAIGTPDQVRRYLRTFEEAGVDQVILVAQAGRNRHDDICAAYELFAREVMPEFHERDAAHRAAKAERLAPALAALAGRPGRAARQVTNRASEPIR